VLGTASDDALAYLVVSVPSSVPSFSARLRPTGTPTSTITTTVERTLELYVFGFSSGETIRIYRAGSSTPILATTLGASGGGLLTWTIPDMPSGTYRLFVDGSIAGVIGQYVYLTIRPSLSLTPTSGHVGQSVSFTAKGLRANTAYSIIFGDVNLGFVGMSNSAGTLSGSFEVPVVLEGTYTVKLVLSSDPTKVAATATFRVVPPPGLIVTPNPSAFPGQLVTFEWDTGVSTLVPPVYVTVLLNETAYTTFPARYEGTKLYGSFQLPNAAPGTIWKLTFAYSDSRQTASWQTVASGSTTFSFQISVDEGTATDPGGFTIPPQDIATFAGIKLRLVVPFTFLEPGADVNVYTVPIVIWGEVVDAATDVRIGWFVAIGSVTVDEGSTPNEGTSGEGTIRVQISSFSFTIASGLAIVVTVGSIDTGADPYTGGSGTASGSTTFTVKSYALANNPQIDTSKPVALRLVSGSGALVMSITSADVARIAGAVNATVYGPIATIVTRTGDRVLARLSDLNATIVEVRDGVALLNTRFGKMFANLSAINATLSGLIVNSKDDVLAKIDTALGPVLAKLDALDAMLVAVHGDTAEIKTVVGDIKLTLESLNATIAGIKDDVVVIKTDVGFIKARIEDAIALLPSVVEFVDATVTDIKSGIEAIKGDTGFIKAKVEDIIALLSAASTTLSNVAGNVSAVRSDIAAVRSDIAEVKALVLEVNTTNVGIVAQAVLTVADQNKAVLDRLDKINATLVGVSGGVAKLSTDVAGLASLVRAANLSISQIVVDQAGRIVVALRDSEGRISGLITTNARTLSDLITAVGKDVAGVADSVKRVSDTLAAFQSGTFSKLDAISGSVDAARADLARLRTDAAATASVVAGIQTTVSRVDTNVGGLVDAAKAIATTVDSINRAVPGLATKADVSGAQTAITGAIDRAKSDLQSAVKSAETAASTSSRNWGVINAILIIIAIAILAYSTVVARRA
jgi:archaellum component FlaC